MLKITLMALVLLVLSNICITLAMLTSDELLRNWFSVWALVAGFVAFILAAIALIRWRDERTK
jgi:hypothetical protein